MWLDILALLLLGFFTGMGVLRGGWASGLGLLSLTGAYAAALLLAPRLGPGLAAQLGVPELLGMALAGAGAFGIAYLALAILAALVRRIHRPFGGAPRSARDRFFGGVFGAVRGGLVVLLFSWLALWVDALRATGAAPGLPTLGRSAAASLTGDVVEAGVGAALSEAGPAGRLVASLAARPASSFTALQGVLEHPGVEALQNDRLFWTYVEHGNVDAALNRGSFYHLARDDALRAQLTELGLVEAGGGDDPGAFRDAMAEVLREVGPRIRGLREDPALTELLEDPEVVAMVQDGDTLALMAHPGFRQLVTRVASRDPAR